MKVKKQCRATIASNVENTLSCYVTIVTNNQLYCQFLLPYHTCSKTYRHGNQCFLRHWHCNIFYVNNVNLHGATENQDIILNRLSSVTKVCKYPPQFFLFVAMVHNWNALPRQHVQVFIVTSVVLYIDVLVVIYSTTEVSK